MESGEIEIVSQLDVYELAVLGVFGVAEVVGGEEDTFKKLFGHS